MSGSFAGQRHRREGGSGAFAPPAEALHAEGAEM
jgi:hypothetical protein